MLRPTIYIPSRFTKLLSRLALSLEDVLPPLADSTGPADNRRSSSADWSRAGFRDPEDCRACKPLWTDSHSLCIG
jgi:hypothetical protein